ncbi:MAG: TIGR02452 family protein [Ruminococcus sp.]|nr:TIGR02452 family protein [Ruminococcus sp.]
MYRNIKIFKDTLKQCHENKKLSDSVRDSINGTRLYYTDDYPEIKRNKNNNCVLSVTKERTFESVGNMHMVYPDSRIGVLNFASAVNAGGGVVLGAPAQEECLCRCSTLYPCLATKELKRNFYNYHRFSFDFCYTDTCIYTPDIMVIKSDTVFPENVDESRWYNADVITCAAPNLSLSFLSKNKLSEIHKKRGKHILSIAVANGIDVLVLGAFGCGAFRNDPEIVADAYKKILPDFMGYFKEIRFAVYCSGSHSKNYDTFRKILLNT